MAEFILPSTALQIRDTKEAALANDYTGYAKNRYGYGSVDPTMLCPSRKARATEPVPVSE